jgi:hypothetical protein
MILVFTVGSRLYFVMVGAKAPGDLWLLLCLPIAQKHIQVLYYIQDLGFGRVYVYPDKQYGRLAYKGL